MTNKQTNKKKKKILHWLLMIDDEIFSYSDLFDPINVELKYRSLLFVVDRHREELVLNEYLNLQNLHRQISVVEMMLFVFV